MLCLSWMLCMLVCKFILRWYVKSVSCVCMSVMCVYVMCVMCVEYVCCVCMYVWYVCMSVGILILLVCYELDVRMY